MWGGQPAQSRSVRWEGLRVPRDFLLLYPTLQQTPPQIIQYAVFHMKHVFREVVSQERRGGRESLSSPCPSGDWQVRRTSQTPMTLSSESREGRKSTVQKLGAPLSHPCHLRIHSILRYLTLRGKFNPSEIIYSHPQSEEPVDSDLHFVKLERL